MDRLASYKLDKAFTEGVIIRPDRAPDVECLVKLPSPYNRGYCQALYGAMHWEADERGQFKTGGALMATSWAQEDAFIEHCLVSVDGEAVGPAFRDEYPELVTELMAKANDLVKEISDRVEEAVKKSSASSSGSKSGQEGRSITPVMNEKAG